MATRLVHPRNSLEDPYGAVSYPLYQTATFDQPSATEFGRRAHSRRRRPPAPSPLPPHPRGVRALPTRVNRFDYTRSGNPTRLLLEEQMAELEARRRRAYSTLRYRMRERAPPRAQGGCRGLAFASGMAALSAVTRLLKVGDRILAGDDIYGGTSRLLTRVVPKAGIKVTNCDMSSLEARCPPGCDCTHTHTRARAVQCADDAYRSHLSIL